MNIGTDKTQNRLSSSINIPVYPKNNPANILWAIGCSTVIKAMQIKSIPDILYKSLPMKNPTDISIKNVNK